MSFKEIMTESPVGTPGRTGKNDAQTFIEENPDVVAEFRKIVQKVGGKAVAKRIIDEITFTPNRELKEEQTQTPEEILRGVGFKIKMVTPTSFGTQIDFAKQYDEDEIKELLKDFNIKIKNKSVFIVD